MKRGGPADDFKLLDLSQGADQFLGKPVGKILVSRITGVVDQREHGDRFPERSVIEILVKHELIREQNHHRRG